jgi:glycosyltransferase involved in cell wall biosynthesis
LYALESRRLAAFERSAWRAADGCAAVSAEDAEAIAGHLDRRERVFVVPNGVDPLHFVPGPDGARDGSLLLLGGLDYHPNRDAADWFLREVLPELRRRIPDARVTIAGRGAAELVRRRSEPLLESSDGDRDARELFARASVLAVPLRVGGGTRIKVLEAMAAGVPVVASRKAVSGLRVEDGVHLLLADEPIDFVRAIESVRLDRDGARQRARAARMLVEREHAWPVIVARMERDLAALREAAR